MKYGKHILTSLSRGDKNAEQLKPRAATRIQKEEFEFASTLMVLEQAGLISFNPKTVAWELTESGEMVLAA